MTIDTIGALKDALRSRAKSTLLTFLRLRGC